MLSMYRDAEGPTGYFFATIFYLITAFLSVVVACLMGVFFDWALGQNKTTVGTIADISFSPQHRCGSVKSRHTCPDTWYLEIRVADGEDVMGITHAPFAWQKIGKHVRVNYILMAFSKTVDIESIYAIQ